MRVILPAKRQAAVVTAPFDFTALLANGTTISSATVTASVYSGTDPTPNAIISGTATISGSVVLQKIAAGVQGTVYSLICTAITSDGQTLELQGFLAVSMDAV